MTQEAIPEPTDDPVTQVQNEMDEQQEAGQAPQALTQEQVKVMLEEQAAGFQRQVSGLQSGFTKALDGMRDQYKAGAVLQNVHLQTELAWDRVINNLDEDTQERIRLLREAEGKAREGAAFEPPANVAQPAAAARQSAQDRMADALILGAGLQLNDPNVNRAILNDTSLTSTEITVQFVASVANAKAIQVAAGQQPQATSQQPAAPPAPVGTMNPPVDRGAGGAAGGLRTVDQLQDALATGQLTVDQYRERMAAIGQTV